MKTFGRSNRAKHLSKVVENLCYGCFVLGREGIYGSLSKVHNDLFVTVHQGFDVGVMGVVEFAIPVVCLIPGLKEYGYCFSDAQGCFLLYREVYEFRGRMIEEIARLVGLKGITGSLDILDCWCVQLFHNRINALCGSLNRHSGCSDKPRCAF